MGQNWFKGLGSRAGKAAPPVAQTPPPAPARRPAEFPPSVGTPSGETAAPATPPAIVTPDDCGVALNRSLAWRAQVLLSAAADATADSDARELVDSLLVPGASFISQPPAAALRALELVRDPDSSVGQTVELFESDPMLAQSLLQTANSAYYRVSEDRMVAIGGALQRVGTSVIEGLLMAATVEKMLCRPGGAFDSMVRMTWTHMQRTAPIARSIARNFGVSPDTAYALALLHDVGKLVIFDRASELRRRKRRDLQLSESFCHLALMHLHEPLGGLAMLRWGMGDLNARTIGGHHRRPIPESPEPSTEMLFVAESIEMARTRGERLDLEAIWARGGITAGPTESIGEEEAA